MTIPCKFLGRAAAHCRSLGAAALIGSLALAGCASGQSTMATPGVPQRGPMDTGTYPNLNVPPQVAAAEMTQEDKANLQGRIASASSRQSASGRGAGTTGDPELLKKLAENHGADTLKAIHDQ